MLAKATPGEPLKLPSKPRHLAGGAEASLAQLVISWSQKNPEAVLKTYIETEAQIDDFVRRMPGLIAALCGDKALGRGPVRSVHAALRRAALDRLEQLQSVRPKQGFRGPSAEIICADHLGRDTPYLLYLPDPHSGSGLRPRENFRDLAAWLMRTAIKGSYRAHVPTGAADAIGAMLYEMFKNTQDHASSDIAGDLLDVSIRAIKTNHHQLAPDQLTRIVGEYPPLAKYCETLIVPRGASFTHLFELSVLDSGSGFAATWTGKPLDQLSLDAEEVAVRECFGRGSAKGESRFGEGLPHVIRLLRRQKGFLRPRTGRLSFYIDFSAEQQSDEAILERYQQADSTAVAVVSMSKIQIPDNGQGKFTIKAERVSTFMILRIKSFTTRKQALTRLKVFRTCSKILG